MKTPIRFQLGSGLLALALAAGCATTQEAEQKPAETAATQNTAPPPPKVKSADEWFAEGLTAYDAGKFEDATAAFAKVLEAAPGTVSAQYNLGLIAEKQGKLSEAQKAYEAAYKLSALHTPTLLNLGKIYRLQGKFDKAVALYEKALQQPGHEYDVQLLNNLTVAYRLAKAYPKAEATARRVLARTKDNPDAYKNLALIYYDQGNYRLAEFVSANARKLDEKDPGVYNNLGMIYLKLEERPQALAQFQKAVTLNDKFAPGHMNIGAMALAYRDYENAEKAFAKAVQLDPNSPEGHLYYAYALDGQKGRNPKKGLAAGAEFEKVLSIRPDAAEAVCGAGWSYSAEKGGWEKAVGFLERCKTQSSAQDQQVIDAKLKTLASLIKSGQAQEQAPAAKKEAPKAGGASMLEKVSDDSAQPDTEAAPDAKPPEPAPKAADPAPKAAAPAAAPAPAAPAAQPAEHVRKPAGAH